jgi:hypothetical protein
MDDAQKLDNDWDRVARGGRPPVRDRRRFGILDNTPHVVAGIVDELQIQKFTWQSYAY